MVNRYGVSRSSSEANNPNWDGSRDGSARPRCRNACDGEQPPARRALDEAFLNEERLDDVLDRVARLRQGRGDGFDADRSAAVIERDGREISPVHGVEPGAIDFERAERLVGNGAVDRFRAIDMREIAQPPQKPAGDARRAARAARDLVRRRPA